MSIARCPQFLPGSGGSVYVLELAAAADARADEAAIIVPPFAEEMNRCRRMMVLLGERLAQRGVRCLLFDFRGTGDSAGDFAAARLSDWREDIDLLRAHALATGARRIHWAGIRFGALLAAEAAARFPESASLLLWEPSASGRQVVSQFARIEQAAQLIARAGKPRPADAERTAQDAAAEIAGYLLTPAMKEELSGLSLDASWRSIRCPVAWFEMSMREGQELTAAGRRYLAALTGEDPAVARGASIAGPAFWSTTEIATSTPLLEASCAFVAG